MAVLWPNLDFERELMGLSPELPRRLLQSIPHVLALGGPGDVLLSPVAFEVPPELVDLFPRVAPLEEARHLGAAGPFLPWGASADARARALRWGIPWEGPAPEVAARVNSKRFSHALEARLGLLLPRCVEVADAAELEEAVGAFAPGESLVLKDPQGFGGQGRLLARGPALTKTEAVWAGRQLSRGPLLVEPWLDRVGEHSVQLEVGRDGRARVLGILRTLGTPGGRYLGSEAGPGAVPDEVRGRMLEIAGEVAAAAWAEGFTGRLGIDAFQWRDARGIHLRPLVEINARATFGAVALSFIERLAGGVGRWELRAPGDLPAGGRVTGPTHVGGQGCERVGVVTRAGI